MTTTITTTIAALKRAPLNVHLQLRLRALDLTLNINSERQTLTIKRIPACP